MKGVKRKNSFLFILFVTIFVFKFHTIVESKKLGLYEKTDAVIILDNTNFGRKVIGSNSAWVVEFYNSWCGHCVRFAPTYKKLASEVKGWRPVLKLGAVDCASKNNTDLCRTYDVNGFPSFQLFPPYTKEGDIGIEFHNQDAEKITERAIDFISNRTIFEPPESWPRLSPMMSMQDIWDETKDKHKHVAFIFESNDSYLGREVILDTLQYPHLLVRRMLKGAVKKFGITTFPSLYLINQDGTFTRIAKNDNSRKGMVEALRSVLGAIQEEAGNKETNDVENRDLEPAQNTQETREGVYMTDLESTLHYSLRQEVAIHREISADKLEALKQFIAVLVKYFPGREEVTSFLARVLQWLKTVEFDMTGDHWLYTIDELQTVSEYLPERIEWVGCHGSQPRYRGYPCGMWTLFHTLTVSAAQMEKTNPRDLPLDVLGAIQGYMKYFFGCQTCVEHFLAMASKITPKDRDSHRAIMWLWQAHNQANQRLSGDDTEDPSHPKVTFPPKSLCSECYKGDSLIEDQVFNFLLKFYGRDEIIQADDSKEDYGDAQKTSPSNKVLDWWELHQRRNDLEKIHSLHMHKLEKQKNKRKNVKNSLAKGKGNFENDFKYIRNEEINFEARQGIFYSIGLNNMDMGMCVVFYVMCTLIILMLYYHFIVRKKYKPYLIFSHKNS